MVRLLIASALLASLLLATIPQVHADNSQNIINNGNIAYDLLIYDSYDNMAAGNYLSNLTVFYKESPFPDITLTGSILGISQEDLKSIIEMPSISHFRLSQQNISALMKNGRIEMNGWTISYGGKGIFQLSDGRFVEGIDVTISFASGSKSAMYDPSTGLLIMENFYISSQQGNVYVFFLEISSYGPVSGTKLPVEKLTILELFSFLIIALAAYSIFNRNKYRVL